MQINSKVNAYILIWAMFLSIIILVSFISISGKINKIISNYNTEEKSDNLNEILKSKEFSNTQIGVDEEIVFEDSKIYKKSLEQNQNTEVRVKSTSNVAFNLKINKGGPIFYSLLLFSGSTFSGTINGSGIIDNTGSFTGGFTGSYDNGIIYIKNLGGYSNFELSSSGKLIKEFENYSIIKKIGNKSVVKKEGSIKIFDLGDFSGIDYKKYGFKF